MQSVGTVCGCRCWLAKRLLERLDWLAMSQTLDPRITEPRRTQESPLRWLVSAGAPFISMVGPVAYWLGWQNPAWFWVPIVVFYLLIPVLDALFGEGGPFVADEDFRRVATAPFYDAVLYVGTAMVWLAFFVNVIFIGTVDLTGLQWFALVISTGTVLGFGLTVSHELGHKHFWIKRKLALFNAALGGYGHFSIEHNHGHHRNVATPLDSASAKMGESIYRFALRELSGGWTRAWQCEGERLAAAGLSRWTWRNEILQGLAFTATLYAGIIVAFGWAMIPALALIAFWGAFQLTSANYVEHYGLKRLMDAQGRFESCKPHHSWNSNHLVSNLMLFHLQRHSDHHTYAARPYQVLRDYADVPRLPSGYFGMFVLAYIPALWFRVMDPLLLKVLGRDVRRINFLPQREADLKARFGLSAH